MIELTIPGVVHPKGRPRFSNQGGFTRTYTPKKTRDYEALVKYHALQLNTSEPLTEAIEVDISVHKVPPKSWSKKKQKEALDGVIKPVTKPDIDNYVKAILDSLNGVLFKDDNQIVSLTVKKVYAEEHKAVVKIREIN